MAYPHKSLNANEEIILDLNPHWWHFVAPLSLLIGATVLGVVLTRLGSTSTGAWFDRFFGWLTWLLVGAALANLVLRALQWSTTHFVVTSQRVIFRHGVIGRIGIDIPLERVNNVSIHQSVLERLVGAGDLLIESGGEDGQQRFTDISKPSEVQNIIHDAIGGHGDPRLTGANGDSVISQLERLEAMFQRGSLTREEFEDQKRRLLG